MTLEEAHKKLEDDWRELEKQVKQKITGRLFWRLLTLYGTLAGRQHQGDQMTQAKTPKQSQYDLDKAMSTLPARNIIKTLLSGHTVLATECMVSQLREAARVQSFEEAAVALAKFACSEPNPDKDLEYDQKMGWGAAFRLHQEKLEKLIQDCKDAMAREAGDK